MDDALTEAERKLIERHGNFYRSLISGKRRPETPAQARFIEAFHGRVAPETEHEIVLLNTPGW